MPGAHMNHLVVLGTGVIGAMGLSAALLCAGAAAAADYDGQAYGEAAAAIEESGGTPVIATRVGGQLPQEHCIVRPPLFDTPCPPSNT